MSKLFLPFAAAAVASLSLAGCASTGPATPSVAVIPASGKSFNAFQRDDDYCQLAAQRAIGGVSPGAVANESAVTSAAVGTALGALAGAAIGSTSGNFGAGAAIGAGTGLVAGSLVGASRGNAAGGAVQAQFDRVYAQCMQTKGNRVAFDAPPPQQVTYVVERPAYVYPRPYSWGPGYRRPYYW